MRRQEVVAAAADMAAERRTAAVAVPISVVAVVAISAVAVGPISVVEGASAAEPILAAAAGRVSAAAASVTSVVAVAAPVLLADPRYHGLRHAQVCVRNARSREAAVRTGLPAVPRSRT